jgi:hypothetical protein
MQDRLDMGILRKYAIHEVLRNSIGIIICAVHRNPSCYIAWTETGRYSVASEPNHNANHLAVVCNFGSRTDQALASDVHSAPQEARSFEQGSDNEKVEQLAANNLTIPQDAIASLLQRLVRSFRFNQRSITITAARVWQWIPPARSGLPYKLPNRSPAITTHPQLNRCATHANHTAQGRTTPYLLQNCHQRLGFISYQIFPSPSTSSNDSTSWIEIIDMQDGSDTSF